MSSDIAPPKAVLVVAIGIVLSILVFVIYKPPVTVSVFIGLLILAISFCLGKLLIKNDNNGGYNGNGLDENNNESPACFLQVDGVSIPLNLSIENLGPAERKKVTLFFENKETTAK